MRRIRRCK